MTTNIAQINVRKDTTANWTSANPVGVSGELMLDTTLKNLRVGDGSTAHDSLPPFLDATGGPKVTVASATTTNLETAVGSIVDISGTTTITGITLGEGHLRFVRFTGALTLTHGASLVLPGAVNVTTVAGDTAIFYGDASSVVRCLLYQKYTVTGTGSAVRHTSPTFVTPVLGVAAATSLAASGAVTSSSASAGVGYATGAGGTGTQASSRTTTVVMSPNPCMSGSITLVSAAGSATPATFTVTNTACAAGDTVVWSQKSGTDKYIILTTNVTAATSFACTFYTTGGTTTEQPVFTFNIIKGVTS